MSKDIYIITSHSDDKEWALMNWKDILRWYNLPFYKKLFTKCPVKELIEISKIEELRKQLDS